jgi:hypothetical protein
MSWVSRISNPESRSARSISTLGTSCEIPLPFSKEEFREGASAWERPDAGDAGNQRPALSRDHKTTTGRGLQSDVESQEAMNRIAEELVKVRGKPVSEWGPPFRPSAPRNRATSAPRSSPSTVSPTRTSCR